MSRGRSWSHQNPYCCFLNQSRRSLSYKEWFTPSIKRAAENGNSFQIAKPSFYTHSPARCDLLSTHQLLTMILLGRLQAADSNVAKKSSKYKSLVRR